MQTDMRLKLELSKVRYYKRNLDYNMGDKRMVALGALPLVFLGWKMIRASGIFAFLKEAAKFAMLTAIGSMKRNFLLNLKSLISRSF